MNKIIGRLLKRKRLESVLWFLVRFNLLAIPLYLAIYTNFSFPPLQVLIAQITSAFLKSLGYDVVQNNQNMILGIGSNFYNIDVSWDSTGWKSLYALFALVIAVPNSNLKSKLSFLSLGLPAVFVLNLFRIVTTILTALNFGFQYFDLVHIFLWREGLIAVVVLLWYAWLRKEKHNIR